MRALVQTAPRRLEVREVPNPAADRVDVALCGICGSDMHAYGGHDPRRPTPLTLGHEIVGRDATGRRVAVNPLLSCGTCRYCTDGRDNLCGTRAILSMPPREGGFAQAVASPDHLNVPIPDGVPDEAAALTEPFACGWHAVRLVARTAPLDDILVLGGGAIGVGAAFALLAQGADRVRLVEPNAARANRLRGIDGIDVLSEPTEAAIVVDGVGIDATRAASFAHVRPGGIVAHIGLGGGTGGFDPRRATLQEITWFGTYTYTAEDFRRTAEAIFDGRIPAARHLDRLVDIRPLEDGAAAFAALAAGEVATPKVMLRP
ncbi:MAG: alcohol dehydrogenase catalytic domain-containing protein [Pseudomonadota bacterium]